MKFNVEEIQGALNLAGISQEEKRAVLEVIEKLAKEKEDEKLPKARKTKRQFVCFLKSSEPITGEVIALVSEIAEDVDYNLTWGSIRKATVSHNEGQKKAKNKVGRFRDVGAVKPKYLKEEGVKLPNKGQWSPTVIVTEKEDEEFLTH